MIALFTDFGNPGFYVGQVQVAMNECAPGVPRVVLMSDAPTQDPISSAYLLAALVPQLPSESVVFGVVDPGVGGNRRAVMVRADERWLVGPDNGLFEVVVARAKHFEVWEILWRPPLLAATFHGRDLFAPVAAWLASGAKLPGELGKRVTWQNRDWSEERHSIIYIDDFGNAMTGIRAASLASNAILEIHGSSLQRGTIFERVPRFVPFWYENSCALVEIAINQASAANVLGLSIGDPVQVA